MKKPNNDVAKKTFFRRLAFFKYFGLFKKIYIFDISCIFIYVLNILGVFQKQFFFPSPILEFLHIRYFHKILRHWKCQRFSFLIRICLFVCLFVCFLPSNRGSRVTISQTMQGGWNSQRQINLRFSGYNLGHEIHRTVHGQSNRGFGRNTTTIVCQTSIYAFIWRIHTHNL